MTNDSPRKAFLVVFSVALLCSVLVSVSAVMLKPIQQRNQLIDRSRNIIALTGLVEPGTELSGDEILEAVNQLDIRVIDIDTGTFAPDIDAADFDARAAVNNPELSTAIPPAEDRARLTRRSRYDVVYLVWGDAGLERVILPVSGQGMWSTLYGYVALESDLNTLAAATFYEQAETAGLGDRIQNPAWLAQWQGRQLFNKGGEFRFRVGPGIIEAGSAAAAHQVDALSGATVTGDAVTQLIAYWFGPHGYTRFLEQLRTNPPQREVNP